MVVAVDVAAAGADATVQTNNVQAGEIACQYIADKLGDDGGKVIIQNGPQVGAVIDRVNGCKEVLGKNPKIEILSDDQDGKGSREGGLNIMQGHLTRFPEIDAVFTINDPQAIGSDLAAKQLGRSEFIITSVDGAPGHRDRAQGQHPGPGLGQPGPVQDRADRGRGRLQDHERREAGRAHDPVAVRTDHARQCRRLQGLVRAALSPAGAARPAGGAAPA